MVDLLPRNGMVFAQKLFAWNIPDLRGEIFFRPTCLATQTLTTTTKNRSSTT